MEVEGGRYCRRRAGDERRGGGGGDEQPGPAHHLPPGAACNCLSVVRLAPGAHRLVEGDEARHGEERHLEAGTRHRLGAQQHHRERGDGKIAHGDRGSVDDDGKTHHGEHDEGALGRHRRAGEHQIAGRRNERRDSRPLLDGVTGPPARARAQAAPSPPRRCRRPPATCAARRWRGCGQGRKSSGPVAPSERFRHVRPR